MIKSLWPILIFIVLFACTNKNFEKKIALKPIPTTVTQVSSEADRLRDYATKLTQIDFDKELSQLKNKKEKEKFRYRIFEFKTTYNKCVDKLEEIESKDSKNSKTSEDKDKKIRQLKELMSQLDIIWQYIITNYNI